MGAAPRRPFPVRRIPPPPRAPEGSGAGPGTGRGRLARPRGFVRGSSAARRLLPELVKTAWWHYILRNRRAAQLRGALPALHHPRVIVTMLPWRMHPLHADATLLGQTASTTRT